MEELMFFWSVEDGELVGYERSGECIRCGECCGVKNTLHYKMRVTSLGSEESDANKEKNPVDWSKWGGWSIFKAHGVWWWFKIVRIEEAPQVCQSYDPDGCTCTVWMDEEIFKPICRYWPFHPSNLEYFPQCGFRFERVETAR
jgi:hypothetical protein